MVAGVWTGVGFTNLKIFRTRIRIQKFWNSIGVGFWKCYYCCNLSGGVALIVWFTTNGMCVKNNTIMYLAWTSNNRVIPMEWSWWVTSYDACEPGEQLIVLANGDDQSDFVGWSLLLLAATVRSSAHMPLVISDRNTTANFAFQKCLQF